ncbi:MAG: gluconate 2-dehydrogenase subunit 3 family protein [Chloroflexi bacterium]|nr:gluconate 2-dehydrogenase subunit 3 family protein [Chloroflexota bacterium]
MAHASSPPATILSDDQRALLAAVLNCLVPAHAGTPGAGDLGVGVLVEQTLASTPAGRRLLTDGLTAIALISGRLTRNDFAALDADAQETVLRAVEAAQPRTLATLVDYTYRGYYTHPRVQAALDFSGAPAQPGGHALPVFDPALLARQRERAPFWRKA